jgi:hypothetical protein
MASAKGRVFFKVGSVGMSYQPCLFDAPVRDGVACAGYGCMQRIKYRGTDLSFSFRPSGLWLLR